MTQEGFWCFSIVQSIFLDKSPLFTDYTGKFAAAPDSGTSELACVGRRREYNSVSTSQPLSPKAQTTL